MEKEFIPYEQALALKELGFEEKCAACFLFNGNKLEWELKNLSSKNEYPHIVSAPLYQQAFRWFRETYNMWSNFYPNYWYIIRIPIDEKSAQEFSCKLGSYEEAELKCLKKLIEIVKQDAL